MDIVEAIKQGKKVRLRSGEDVTIYTTEAKNNKPIFGSYRSKFLETDELASWYADGKFTKNDITTNSLDLIVDAITKYIIVFHSKDQNDLMSCFLYDSKEEANSTAIETQTQNPENIKGFDIIKIEY